MVLMPEPLFAAVEAVDPPRPLLSWARPAAASTRRGRELAGVGGFSLLCGRYEGVDERVREHLCDGELSIGDFVLAGGEVAAMVVLEAVGRLVPGVMGNEASADDESFSDGLLEYPQYTRPADFRGWAVPEVLRCGDHGRVARWRRAQALRRTLDRRPDLIDGPGRPRRRPPAARRVRPRAPGGDARHRSIPEPASGRAGPPTPPLCLPGVRYRPRPPVRRLRRSDAR